MKIDIDNMTLDQCWSYCLRMWRWIAKEKKAGNEENVHRLKIQWIRNNSIPEFISSCFFCLYAKDGCHQCPAKRVDKDFGCEKLDYKYDTNPIAFYAELLRLNKIRKGVKK